VKALIDDLDKLRRYSTANELRVKYAVYLQGD
jgi:hypothetical protein